MKMAKSLLTCWISVLLASCGDGSSQLAEGGITGSGISFGPITAFGSVWVGGVRYDVSTAEFIRNGKLTLAGQDDFQVGELVSITGKVNPDGVTGVASKVEFDRDISGLVTAASTDGKTIEVLGQKVVADPLTLFDGFIDLRQLSIGNVLEISGSRNAAGTLLASTIKRTGISFTAGTTELELEGNISAVNPDTLTFKVGDLTVDYGQSILNGLTDPLDAQGVYVEIQTKQNLADGALVAEQIAPEAEFPTFAPGSYTKLDGRVSAVAEDGSFTISGLTIDITTATTIRDGSITDIGSGAHLKVAGRIDESGRMAADEIDVRQSADPASQLELKGEISSILSEEMTLTVLGNTIVVDDSTIILDHSGEQASPLAFSELTMADYIKVNGRKLSNGRVLALRIDRNPPVLIIDPDPVINPAPVTDTTDNTNTDGSDTTDSTDNTNTDGSDTTDSTDNTNTDGNDTTDSTDSSNTGTTGTDNSSNSSTADTAQITGILENVSRNNGSLQIGNSLVLTDFTTQYYQQGETTELLSPGTFYNRLVTGETRLEVSGSSIGSNWILAGRILILKD